MPKVSFIIDSEVPAGHPITKDGIAMGTVIESVPYGDKFAITADVNPEFVLWLHKPTFSMSISYGETSGLQVRCN